MSRTGLYLLFVLSAWCSSYGAVYIPDPSYAPNPSRAFGYLGGEAKLSPCGTPRESSSWIRLSELNWNQCNIDPYDFKAPWNGYSPAYGYVYYCYLYRVAPNFGSNKRSALITFKCDYPRHYPSEVRDTVYNHQVRQSAPTNIIETIIAIIVYIVGGYWLF